MQALPHQHVYGFVAITGYACVALSAPEPVNVAADAHSVGRGEPAAREQEKTRDEGEEQEAPEVADGWEMCNVGSPLGAAGGSGGFCHVEDSRTGEFCL